MDCSWADAQILSEQNLIDEISTKTLHSIKDASGSRYLNGLAGAALNPRCTDTLFALYEPIIVELAARWLSLQASADDVEVVAAFSRILPLAPYLSTFTKRLLANSQEDILSSLSDSRQLSLLNVENEKLSALLLALFRLLSFDANAFGSAISPIQLQSLFQHRDRVIRYLAIRCFCLYMHAADTALQKMIKTYLGEEIIEGQWEGRAIDYGLFSLWEEKRWKDLESRLQKNRTDRRLGRTSRGRLISRKELSAQTAEIAGVLVPRLARDMPQDQSSLVHTSTTEENLRNVAEGLLGARPILLTGIAGCGKTRLITHMARELQQLSSMITLHLNEQTDAKSLLGLYTVSTMTGSFTWQPGVLTKAVKEGRWILIEDLDRAPSEVISVLLPLIEKGELFIPNRNERIRSTNGFKIFATIRSTVNSRGENVFPGANMLGIRLWRRVDVQAMNGEEVRDVVANTYQLLQPRVPMIMAVYHRVLSVSSGFGPSKGNYSWSPGLRDLMKFCRRIERRLRATGVKTGHEAISDSAKDDVFMDAVDCFAGSLQSSSLRSSIASSIAEEMQIPPQRMHYCLSERKPIFSEQEKEIWIGRQVCQKINRKLSWTSNLASTRAMPFAPTRHALRTMEQIAAAVQLAEPVLLVGETGVGKTSTIQQLARLIGQNLTVINLSQQSESSDLLGGFKPVTPRSLAMPMLGEFNQLFERTFSSKKNERFLSMVRKGAAKGSWPRLVNLWKEAVKMAQDIFQSSDQSNGVTWGSGLEQPSKKRRLDSPKYMGLRNRWDLFASDLKTLETQISRENANFAFAFVEGKIVKALRDGQWILLDEINLASQDTLESIASLLQNGGDSYPSVLLSEAGDVERVNAHPDFRVFGAMNPATDAGKRDLASGLRSRFTEIFVQSPDTELDDLLSLVRSHLGLITNSDERAAFDITRLYVDAKKLNVDNRLTDGAGQRPHFSVRTLVRTLMYVTDHASIYGIRRALYEGFSMSFLTMLSKDSERLLIPLLDRYILGSQGNVRSLLSQTPRIPADGKDYVRFKHYWMTKGAEEPREQPQYIITPFIERNLLNLVRASSTRRFPVLLQGPTSSGKTSMIQYLAKISGNRCVRINNHEHTDLQEYLGSYVSGGDERLYYQEGILVEALRKGYWIVLDELNLAPTDVLEALNRLLDDNRELLIPETQEVIKPHPNFMLFATQNPAGLYGGRKVLSRAFRNRFLELHFDDIPEEELEFILRERSQIAPSFCTRIVSVYKKLSILRQSSRLFEQRNSFATLRDLFRWAFRQADDREQLAINGFMLLAERVRDPQERAAVRGVIEEVMKVKIDEASIYSTPTMTDHLEKAELEAVSEVIWTFAMRRLFVLVSKAIENNEPVLLIGETGCGKTQLCQAVAEIYGKQLHIVNANINTETGDLIGAQRPVRNRSLIEERLAQDLKALLVSSHGDAGREEISLHELLKAFYASEPHQSQQFDADILRRVRANITKSKSLFEWSDGSLVSAMKSGQHFLLDEISLADDSVLERLNSVLEPQRTLLLAEKGPHESLVVASEGFSFLATMNPGGDYGKRELSGALRNRLTEIWVPPLAEDEDVLPILKAKIKLPLSGLPKVMLEFAKWFKDKFHNSMATSISIRDLLSWVQFVNECHHPDPHFAIVHGAAMVFIDTLGANPAAMLALTSNNIERERMVCLQKLTNLLRFDASAIYYEDLAIRLEGQSLQIGQFNILVLSSSPRDPDFILDAPTTLVNSMRIARALQGSKPILLEGSPGVGKTTLIMGLARVIGKPVTRINLSEQTDLTDLFGSDIPIEGGEVGHFAWRDAPFLRAMQRGEWVLLDEMNLASQAVLEGLNSCLDHRHEVYISELDQTFHRHPDFVLFAAQNPHHQGGGRKGLPASFVNRFTVVYADAFREADLTSICGKMYPEYPTHQIQKLVAFVTILADGISIDHRIGSTGGPWEINLRDIIRWLKLLTSTSINVSSREFLDVVIRHRFRTDEDRSYVLNLFTEVSGSQYPERNYFHNLAPTFYQVGLGYLKRSSTCQHVPSPPSKILSRDLPTVESLLLCIQQKWPSILVGPAGCGKKSLLRHVAALGGAHLVELSMNSEIDTMDLIGGFEQVDLHRKFSDLIETFTGLLQSKIIDSCTDRQISKETATWLDILQKMNSHDVQNGNILALLQSFHSEDLPPGFLDFIGQWEALSHTQQTSLKAQFEWTEGTLVQAVQQGHWVLLDNANLCSSSVLDRLNSLLEPNGHLTINEQHTADGSIKVVEPHPDFRIFLTMDSRHGELSRAMRNRAVEIFMKSESDRGSSSSSPVVSYLCESSIYRFRQMQDLEYPMQGQSHAPLVSGLAEVVLDHLSLQDFDFMQNLKYNIAHSLISFNNSEQVYSSIEKYSTLLGKGSHGIRWKTFQDLEGIYEKLETDFRFPKGFAASQPLNALNNAPALNVSTRDPTSSIFFSLACLQELALDLLHIREALERIEVQALTREVIDMTRLERSMVSQRLPRLANDSTQPVSAFLTTLSQAIDGEMQRTPGDIIENQSMIEFLQQMVTYCRDMIILTFNQDFDEGAFQTFLQNGRSLASKFQSHHDSRQPVVVAFRQGMNYFNAGWKLSTGLSMQRMWSAWRPMTAVNLIQLESVLSLEKMATRFNTALWKVRLPVEQLNEVRELLLDARTSSLTDDSNTDKLMQKLEYLVPELEAEVTDEGPVSFPYFADLFEGICQYHEFQSSWKGQTYVQNLQSLIQFLACRSISPLEGPNAEKPVPHLLSKVARLSGCEGPRHNPMAVSRKLSISLLAKLNRIGEVTLDHMDLLCAELSFIGRSVALSTSEISVDQFDLLDDQLCSLLYHIIICHKDFFEPGSYERIIKIICALRQRQEVGPMPWPLLRCRNDLRLDFYFEQILQTHIIPCFEYLISIRRIRINRPSAIGAAWIHIAMASLKLYVPDRPLDPSMELVVKRRLHGQRTLELRSRIQALTKFEETFTGQSTSLRIRILKKHLENLGAEPSMPAVVRPIISQLPALQGEFMNLLNSDVLKMPANFTALEQDSSSMSDYSPTPKDEQQRQEVDQLHRSIKSISGRLMKSYEAYRDITIPVVRMLQCLDLGISLASMESGGYHEHHRALKYISTATPFLEATPAQIFDAYHVIDKPYYFELILPLGIWDHRFSFMIAIQDTDPQAAGRPKHSWELLPILQAIYKGWKSQLERDQRLTAEQSKTYRYKGQDDENQDASDHNFRELFPIYDDTAFLRESNIDKSKADPKLAPRRLAGILDKMFASESKDSILEEYLIESTKMIGSVFDYNSMVAPLSSENLLPGLLLSIQRSFLVFEARGSRYNFYSDSNAPEARNFVRIARAVKLRFTQIRKAWPEHATPQDVIACCSEILTLKHSEPAAKFLTKAEKLHGIVHEWQTVATREFSAAVLHQELTDLLIRWRRLELSTWARLLEIEKEKCEEDAKSWWFVAYEVLIAIPLEFVRSGGDLVDHTKNLLSTLESFILATTMGEFSPRMRLLENFRSLLELFISDNPSLAVVLSALSNFLRHYIRFESIIKKTLSDGRRTLERDIKQEIQLASWRDTNIVALRESARRSHHKLFKVIRKYRSLLASSTESVLTTPPPEIDQGSQPTCRVDSYVSRPSAPRQALRMCQTFVSNWESKLSRFKDPNGAVISMIRVYESSSPKFQVSGQLDDFIVDVIETMKTLQSQTPAILSEQNKNLVQHLKARKRRFFAEKLKDLRQMGIRTNPGTEALEEQNSLATVLASAPHYSSPKLSLALQSSESYFHRLLDILPRVRGASRDHSEDLTSAEVIRSVGSLEGLLFLIRKQRDITAPALRSIATLEMTVQQLSNLWRSNGDKLEVRQVASEQRNVLRRTVTWLPNIVHLGCTILEIHANFAQIDSTQVLTRLQAWKERLAVLGDGFLDFVTLPPGISTSVHQKRYDEARALLDAIQKDLDQLIEENPMLAFALKHIKTWATYDWYDSPEPMKDVNDDFTTSIEELDANIQTTMDKTFVALQKVSQAMASAPSSPKDQAWLVKANKIHAATLKALHMDEINSSVEALLIQLQYLDNDSLPLASAIFTTMLPVVQQYKFICDDVLDRYSSLHRETCKMSYILGKSFTQVASEGFCSPSDASAGGEGDTGKMESGTGLGEGEGAQDISKDVQDDEDLSELAQQPNTKEQREEEVDNIQDAVDMGQDDIEGEFDDSAEVRDDEEKSDRGEDQDEGSETDEETGSVDNLDPSAVDEKLWDGAGKEDEKQTENEKGKGVSQKDEQAAAAERKKAEKKDAVDEIDQDADEDDENDAENEAEVIGRKDVDITDPHARDESALDLPEEMQLDADKKSEADTDMEDGLDELSDIEHDPTDTEGLPHDEKGDGAPEEALDSINEVERDDRTGEEEDGKEAMQGAQDEEDEDQNDVEKSEDRLLAQQDEETGNEVNIDVAAAGLGAEWDDSTEQESSGNAKQNSGTRGNPDALQQQNCPTEGEQGQNAQAVSNMGGQGDDADQDLQVQVFKKLGDVLKNWHRQHRQIQKASEDQKEPQTEDADIEMADPDFEHLANEEDRSDTQALGAASDEQARPLDQSRALDTEMQPNEKEFLPDITEDDHKGAPDAKQENGSDQIDDLTSSLPARSTARTFIADPEKTFSNPDKPNEPHEDHTDLNDMDTHLSTIQLSSSTVPPLTSPEEARRLWSNYESMTRDLSLSLTEQLRLILAATLATKMRGDFRTGKRLNIKRIIPYIASQYKRDKIWMRRSVPSKRNYQIMLAVDDSKSMLESGSGELAFETLALVAKSLSMLEVGDLCIVSFGNEDHVRVAHEFGKPFTSEAGSQVFQQFSYQQTGTNVRRLVADSIALFHEARNKQSSTGGGSTDLWQLELIISDGICEDHDSIRRLIMQASEERIMIVFVIVDAAATVEGGSSILDLTQATFEPDEDDLSGKGDMKLKMKRYLEGFPFRYYLVVRDVKELPGVLAMALKQWFAEVVDAAG